MPSQRARLFVITDFECLTQDSFCSRYNAQYMAGALETCPTTGRSHMQGVVYYENARSIAALGRKRKNNVEVAKADILDAAGYCAKGTRAKPEAGYRVFLEDPCEGFFQVGERPSQGSRTDLKDFAKQVQEGRSVDSIVMENPQAFHCYGRTLERIEDIVLRKKFRMAKSTEGLWLWGPTGVGKSHAAFQGYSPETHYVLNVNDNGWWEGYVGQDIVVINDFRGQLPYCDLLLLVDEWPHTVKRRNRACMPFTSKKLIITSSLPPHEVYHNLAQRDSFDQLYRRFKIVHMQTREVHVVQSDPANLTQ